MKDIKWVALIGGALLTLYSLQAFVRLESAMKEFGGTLWKWDFFYYHPIRMILIPATGVILLAVAAFLFLRRRGAE